MKRSLSWVALAVLSLVVFGCGGGSSGGDAPKSITALVTFSTTGALPTGIKIGAVQVTLQAPAGIVVTMDPNSAGQPLITGVPTDALASGSYASATNTATVGVMSAAGFATGNVFTLSYTVPSSMTPPVVGDFVLTVKDLGSTNGTDLRPGVGLVASVQFQ